MDWVKKNPHNLALAILALGLLVASALVLMQTQSFADKFAEVNLAPMEGTNIPPVDAAPIEAAQKELTTPATWNPDVKTNGPMFVSEKFILENGTPVKPTKGAIYTDTVSKQPILNEWFLNAGLPLLDPTVPKQDPDKDGFFNEDEWRHNTNPNDAKSHPPYHTKVYLAKYIAIQFRLRFDAYDQDPVTKKTSDYQINTVDRGKRTEILSSGEMIPGTKFKVDKFEFKEALNPNTGEKSEVSELTVINTETQEPVILIFRREVNSPESFGLLSYIWPTPAQEIRVKRLQEFVLRPDVAVKYKLLDVNASNATIQLPSGEKYTVPPLPR